MRYYKISLKRRFPCYVRTDMILTEDEQANESLIINLAEELELIESEDKLHIVDVEEMSNIDFNMETKFKHVECTNKDDILELIDRMKQSVKEDDMWKLVQYTILINRKIKEL